LKEIIILFILLCFKSSYADDDIDLFSLSLEELVNLKVSTGGLSTISNNESTSAITVIRSEQITNSSARNLATLLEQYVPGLILMNHSEGDKIGLRGLIAAENYKLLLLVNGKNMTNMVYEGVITEIDQWDLGDIKQVEVVRGPGSVTYGTGAIAGVINIITKSSKDTLPTFSAELTTNPQYESKGMNLQFSSNYAELGIYGFASYRDTNGYQNPDYFVSNPNNEYDNRYLGKNPDSTLPPQPYLADTGGRAQIKGHIDVNYGDSIRIWARYTQSGQTHGFNLKKEHTNSGEPNGKLSNSRAVSTRSFISSIEHINDIDETQELKLSLTYDTQEYIRNNLSNKDYSLVHVNNINNYAFSQNRLNALALYSLQYTKELNVILGYEYNNINVGSPWGENKDHLWIREGASFISSVETSVYTQDMSLNSRPDLNRIEEVGNGLDFQTHTNLVEMNYKISKDSSLLYAHRIDFPDVSGYMFSPRISYTKEVNSENMFIVTGQRAQRMMPLRAQYLHDKYSNGNDSEHETLESVELLYNYSGIEHSFLSFRTFYNDIQAVGFTGEKLEFLSDLELIGIEFEATYKKGNTHISFNHSYINPISVDMNEELKTGTNRNNISFADYYYNTVSGIPLLLESYGDGLNNVPSNVTKVVYEDMFFDGKLMTHINLQI
jgi:outer membrane receptor for ferrienterochelin and colicin